jgi:hypothetical protein
VAWRWSASSSAWPGRRGGDVHAQAAVDTPPWTSPRQTVAAPWRRGLDRQRDPRAAGGAIDPIHALRAE